MPIPRNLSIPSGGATRYTILRCSLNSDANPDPQPERPDYPGCQKRFGRYADWIGVRRYDAGPPPPGGRRGPEPC